jgi:hypothetical protein
MSFYNFKQKLYFILDYFENTYCDVCGEITFDGVCDFC